MFKILTENNDRKKQKKSMHISEMFIFNFFSREKGHHTVDVQLS